jgi:hypothetical protein
VVRLGLVKKLASASNVVPNFISMTSQSNQ